MVPNRIRPFFKTTQNKLDGENTLVRGYLECCNSDSFTVEYVGDIHSSFLSGIHLLPAHDEIKLIARCTNCRKVIVVFDSRCDGYDPPHVTSYEQSSLKSIGCTKCASRKFQIEVIYEYPDLAELDKLAIPSIDNAFTWIWISLKCCKCGKLYRRFIDFDTT